MAVYTKLNQEELNNILLNYKLGNLKKFEGIKEGIENTNYFIETEKGKYILTIYEKRVNKSDLPFFSKLMLETSKKNFICPKPISNKDNNYISDLNDKKLQLSPSQAEQILVDDNKLPIGFKVNFEEESPSLKNELISEENQRKIKSIISKNQVYYLLI